MICGSLSYALVLFWLDLFVFFSGSGLALERSFVRVFSILQIRSHLLRIMVGVDDARAILSSQTLSYRATFVEEIPFVVEQARHPACLWAKYFDLDVDKP